MNGGQVKVEVSGYDEALLLLLLLPFQPIKGKPRSCLKGVGERQIKARAHQQAEMSDSVSTIDSLYLLVLLARPNSDINSHITPLSALYSFHSSTLIFLPTTPHPTTPLLFPPTVDRSPVFIKLDNEG